MRPAKNDTRQWAPEPYVPLFQAILGVEGDARTLAARGEGGEVFETARSSFKFEMLADLQSEPPKSWLVYKFLAESEFVVWYGEPGGGKSVAAADVAAHVASGRDWLGMKVNQKPVLYFAAERRSIMARRFLGLQRLMELPSSTPLCLGSGQLDIRDSNAADGFIDAILEMEDAHGQAVGLVVLDTLSKNLSGGDENSSIDVGAAVKNIERIREATTATVMAIHHVGAAQDSKERMRGSTVLLGAVDGNALVTGGNGGLTIKLKKNNDDPETGRVVRAEIASFETGVDDEDEPVSVPYLRLPSGNMVGLPPIMKLIPKALAPAANVALASLRKAMDADGIASDGSPGFPADVPSVSREQWREAWRRDDEATAPNATPATRRKRFNRGLEDLEKAGRIGVLGDRVWLID
jgi:hypothetical protein